jgi:hypothetical protein
VRVKISDRLRLASELAFETLFALKNCPPKKDYNQTIPVKGGIYAFYEKGQCMYVGRSKNLDKRNRQHRQSQAHGAPLAVAMARKDTGHGPTYTAPRGLKKLLQNSAFFQAFKNAQRRIGEMEFIWAVQENDDAQALAEHYARIELKPLFGSARTS